MVSRNVVRFGGLSGVLFVVLFIPSYVSAPDTPSATSSAQELLDHLGSNQAQILFLNGVLLIFAGFFFLWFLGVLHRVLEEVAHEGYGFASVALAGGLLFLALMLAGAAVEIIHPATQTRFANFHLDAQLGFVSLALSGWIYRFAFIGMSVLIAATSAEVLATGLMPKWVGWAGIVCAVVALFRFLGPLGGWLTLVWIVVVSVFMIVGTVRRSMPLRGTAAPPV